MTSDLLYEALFLKYRPLKPFQALIFKIVILDVKIMNPIRDLDFYIQNYGFALKYGK